MQIQQAGVRDAEAILILQKLAYRSEAEIYNEFSIQPLTQTPEEIEQEFESLLFLKAQDGERIIGSVRAREEQGTCFIGKLIVHPASQNQGLGTNLMNEIEGRFGRAERFELFTGHRSERNLHLYRKLGYRVFREQEISEKLTLLFMEKENSGPGNGSIL